MLDFFPPAFNVALGVAFPSRAKFGAVKVFLFNDIRFRRARVELAKYCLATDPSSEFKKVSARVSKGENS